MTRNELAKKCLTELVKHVLLHQGKTLESITYAELARRVGFLNRHGVPYPRLGRVLGKMGNLVDSVQPSLPEKIPIIQSLVVNKSGLNRGIPDDGIKAFWKDYDKLTRPEKENKAYAEWQIIAEFGSRWNTVLIKLNLSAIDAPTLERQKTYRGSGGESPAHKALKNHIKNNPHLVSVDDNAESFEEYALPSLDTLDILFKTPTCWTAVEVKSSVSDYFKGDYERGIYQTVKYTALLRAMRNDTKYNIPKTIRVILALEKALPSELCELKSLLEIEVIEHITFDT